MPGVPLQTQVIAHESCGGWWFYRIRWDSRLTMPTCVRLQVSDGQIIVCNSNGHDFDWDGIEFMPVTKPDTLPCPRCTKSG
jgi:hypothetical protein